MASPSRFKYMEWIIVEVDNWHLKEDAPDYVVKAYKEWIKETEMKVEE